MKKILASLLVAVSLVVSGANAEPLPAIEQDIIAAGNLRLQSQRLAKLWLQAGLGIQAQAATRQLQRGRLEFENALGALAPYAARAETRRLHERTAELWEEYRKALSLPYGEDNLKTVNYLADDLMLASGRLAARIEAEAEGATGRLLDLSLRQNMLAQRLARLYLMAQAGDRTSGRLIDIEQSRREFATALQELNRAGENTPASREALELANVQWVFFNQAISDMRSGRNSLPQHVATASERISETLDLVSRQYALSLSAPRYAATATAATRKN